MDFDTWAKDAWDRHGDEPAGIAAQITANGAAAANDEAQLVRLAQLAHHVLGEHLARWDDAAALLRALTAHPHYRADGDSGRALQLYGASLALSQGAPHTSETLELTERIRARALAAGNQAPHDAPRALALLRQAADDDVISGLPDTSPHVRALAATGNNIACAMEALHERSAEQRELMILAAQTARACWARAGGWLETERAEYRLARTWLEAGDAEQAREHALLCLEIVEAHGAVALERFFGWEALALAERAAGDTAAFTQAVARAQEAFDALEASDRGWCRASLDALVAA